MNYTELYDNIRCKGSFLCVGLDTDPEKIPACVRERHGDASMLAFNKAIIDATAEYAVAYKPNIAFYEAEGVAGWRPRVSPAGNNLLRPSATSGRSIPTSSSSPMPSAETSATQPTGTPGPFSRPWTSTQ